MIKIIFLTFILLIGALHLSTSKSTVADPRSVQGVHKELQLYVDMYTYSKGSALSKDISIGFGDLNGKIAVAACMQWKISGFNQIIVNEKAWNAASMMKKKHIMYHELGHCDLGLEHNDTRIKGKRTSLMNTNYFKIPASDFKKYTKELFNKQ